MEYNLYSFPLLVSLQMILLYFFCVFMGVNTYVSLSRHWIASYLLNCHFFFLGKIHFSQKKIKPVIISITKILSKYLYNLPSNMDMDFVVNLLILPSLAFHPSHTAAIIAAPALVVSVSSPSPTSARTEVVLP